MRRFTVLALTLVAASPVVAQRPATPVQAAPPQERAAQAAATTACELLAPSGLRLPFQECGASRALAGARTREVEVVEYRNGDARLSARLQQQGTVHRDIAVRSVSVGDPDDDGDGFPAVAAARRPGRTKVGRMTLRASTPDGIGILTEMWHVGDVDGDGFGFPLSVILRDDAAGEGRVDFGGCTPVGMVPAASSSPAVDLTLRCRTAEMVKALDANPYARFISESQGSAAREQTLVEQLRGRTGSGERVRLQGATLRGWSLEWMDDGARQDRPQWTLEVRVNRIELA